jgi:tRNA(fMet)-specific endonuclease VapC
MSYLLDTNACIALINGRPSVVRKRLRLSLERGDRVWLSSVALFELWYGVAKSELEERNTERLAVFMSPFEVLTFDEEDARRAGAVRAMLERAGSPIGAYDLLIAGQALRHELVLVTANVAEFSRVAHLRWEDWSTA